MLRVLSGINGTIFAYGPTGSGKTFTMTGSITRHVDRGLIPRVLDHVFSAQPLSVVVSYLEVYNERGYDLMAEGATTQVRLLQDANKKLHLRPLTKKQVCNRYEALDCLLHGEVNRAVRATTDNPRSSRSHTVFTIALEMKHSEESFLHVYAKLRLVDLAGSERHDKQHSWETRHINLSLHYLEQVILALSDHSRSHVPYRNSLLTALLKDSLAGNCNTAMVATLSTADLQETVATCRFAQRVSMVRIEPSQNITYGEEKELEVLRSENERLRAQLRLCTRTEAPGPITEQDAEQCQTMISKFLIEGHGEILALQDATKIEYCFGVLKEEILRLRNEAKRHTAPSKKERNFTVNEENKQAHLMEKYKEFLRDKVELLDRKRPEQMQIPKINVVYEEHQAEAKLNNGQTPEKCKANTKAGSENQRKDVEKKHENSCSESLCPWYKAGTPARLLVSKVLESDSGKEAKYRKGSTGMWEEPAIEPESFNVPKTFSKSDNSLSPRNKNEGYLSRPLWEEPIMDGSYSIQSNTFKTTGPLTKEHQHENQERQMLEAPPSNRSSSFSTIGLFTQEGNWVENMIEGPSSNRSSAFSTIGLFTQEGNWVENMIEGPSSNRSSAFSTTGLLLTGDSEVDEEIVRFYKARYEAFK